MNRHHRHNFLLQGILLAINILAFHTVYAAPTTAYQAEEIVQNWLGMNSHPLEEAMAPDVGEVVTYRDTEGSPLYHVVYLAERGFVIVSGDDMVEPIIAVVPDGIEYINSEDNPLGAMVNGDVPHRIKYVRTLEIEGMEAAADNEPASILAAQRKWKFLSGKTLPNDLEAAFSSISDVRVAPITHTKWNQEQERSGQNCYNLYTPNNYPCGCVATAMSQLMRFFEFPTASIPQNSYEIKVSNDGGETYETQNRRMMGGVYEWHKMPNGPTIPTPEQRQAIGKLTHDTGCALNMKYSSRGSGAAFWKIGELLKHLFGYSNAVTSSNYPENIETDERNTMVNPNLDAGRPVVLGLINSNDGHAVIADGYGYDNGTLYHHLNLGWGGSSDAWYNLPDIKTHGPHYTLVKGVVYNIYKTGYGEIISGRVTDRNGSPIAGATVSTGETSDVSDAHGIYALEKLMPRTTHTINAVKEGYYFSPLDVTVGRSEDGYHTGNVWGADLIEEDPPLPDSYEPDNSSETAKRILANTTQTHSIVPADDEDWVIFTLSSQSDITLETSGPPGGNTVLRLYNSEVEQLDFNHNAGAGDYSRIRKKNLPAGTYYARIDEYWNDDIIRSYMISLSVTHSGPGTPPTAPSNVNATDGTHTDKVQITWDSVADATSYTVYRCAEDSSTDSCSSLGDASSNLYDDMSATPGTTYYYRVKASNSSGTGDMSDSDAGYRDIAPPSTPSNVNATDGTYTDKVRITWDNVAAPTSCTVYRCTDASTDSCSSLGDTSSSLYDDMSATPETTYHYRVKAFNSSGMSEMSDSDTGYRATAPPSTPSNVNATDGTYTDKVRITWDSVANATSYKVYRCTNSSTDSCSSLGDASSSPHDDTSASPETTYYYRVKASNSSGTSGMSNYDTGYRDIAPPPPPSTPSNVNATDGAYTDKVRITWDSVSGATSYKVYRCTDSSTNSCTYLTSDSSSPYNDTRANPGTTYYYRVKASNSSGTSGMSNYDTGYRTAGDSYEPDNSRKTAKSIAVNTRQMHSIIPADDQDWVKFTLPSQSSISLETSGSSGGDTKLWLYNSSLEEIAVNDNGGTGSYSLITRRNLSTGTYYAKVEEFGNDNEIRSYTLTLTVSNSGALPTISQPEPMNRATLIQKSPAQVLRVAVTDTSNGTFYYGDNKDNLRPVRGTIRNEWLEATIPYAATAMNNNGTTYWYVEAENPNGTKRYPENGILIFRVFATPPFFVPNIIEWQ